MDRVSQGSKSPCSVEKRGVVLETLLDTPVLGVGVDAGGGSVKERDGEADGVVRADG